MAIHWNCNRTVRAITTRRYPPPLPGKRVGVRTGFSTSDIVPTLDFFPNLRAPRHSRKIQSCTPAHWYLSCPRSRRPRGDATRA